MFKLPNILTISRIVLIPGMIAAFYMKGNAGNWTAFALFAIAAATDFFDGYFARSWNQRSKLGQFLDPVADKLLVAAAIFMLVAVDRISGLTVLPAIIILSREILVSGLREFLAEIRVSVPVTKLAKWKTAMQLFAIGILIIGDAAPDYLPTIFFGEALLWLAAVLTLYTGYDYLRAGLKHLDEDMNA